MIINLTPHVINIMDNDNNIIRTITPSGIVARVSTKPVLVGQVDGLNIYRTEYGQLENLPDAEEGLYYIVSALCKQRCKDRDDVFIINDAVRDAEGNTIGCRSLGLM